MALRRLIWTPKFIAKYQRLQNEAFADLESGKDRRMRRFLRVSDTLKKLAAVPGPPENDRQLDTRTYLELSGLARSEKTVHGSRATEEPADFRVLWRYSREEEHSLELVDLIWPCL
jgi:hypothetical protein